MKPLFKSLGVQYEAEEEVVFARERVEWDGLACFAF
jgi:hypothetical protein